MITLTVTATDIDVLVDDLERVILDRLKHGSESGLLLSTETIYALSYS